MHKKNHFFLLFIILLFGIFCRFYRIYDLGIFLADQASDSTAVWNMMHGDWTLLGPITSVGGFYNGPIVYYLMLPFYVIFQGSPISGTIFQSTLSVATIPLLYYLGKKIMNESVGLIAAFLFALSPLMVDYSRAAFNAHPAIFFSTAILYLFFEINDHYAHLKTLLLGICIGFIIQMHYFTLVFLLLTLLYPLFFNKKLRSLSYYFFLLMGVGLGLSPFLLFELRNHFLNTSLFLKYMTSSRPSERSFMHILTIWPHVTAALLLGNQYIAGLIGFLLIGATIGFVWIKKMMKRDYLILFMMLFGLVFVTGALYGNVMQNHYIIAIHTSLILFCAILIYLLGRKNHLVILTILTLLVPLNFQAWNLTQKKHPLQDGLSMADFQKTAAIIKNDKKETYNVAMHAQGDNRAMPLRYSLTIIDEHPMNYDNYGDAQTLYFLMKTSESLAQQKMWEYTSFGPSIATQKWNITDDYYLYQLDKKK